MKAEGILEWEPVCPDSSRSAGAECSWRGDRWRRSQHRYPVPTDALPERPLRTPGCRRSARTEPD